MTDVYTFDASISVDAREFENEEAAADWILDAFADLDIAAFLCKEGTLNNVSSGD